MTRLSILTAWSENDDVQEDTLASILQNRPDDCEIIVVHRQNYDDPYELGSEVRFLPASADASLLEMLNLGADEAEGDILHIIRSGVRATEGWTEPALLEFQDPGVASVVPLVLNEPLEQIVVAGAAIDRAGGRCDCGHGLSPVSTTAARLQPLGPALAAGFYRIEAWDAAWGLDNQMGAAADADLAICLQQIGESRLCLQSVLQEVSPAETESAARQGRAQQRLFLRHGERRQISASANRLARWVKLLSQCYRPSAWSEAVGRWTAKFTARELSQFAERWEDLLDAAQEASANQDSGEHISTARRAA